MDEDTEIKFDRIVFRVVDDDGVYGIASAIEVARSRGWVTYESRDRTKTWKENSNGFPWCDTPAEAVEQEISRWAHRLIEAERGAPWLDYGPKDCIAEIMKLSFLYADLPDDPLAIASKLPEHVART